MGTALHHCSPFIIALFFCWMRHTVVFLTLWLSGCFQCHLLKEISVKLPPFHLLLPSVVWVVLTVPTLDWSGRISSILQLHSDINFYWDPSKTWAMNCKIRCIQSVCLCNINQLNLHRRSTSLSTFPSIVVMTGTQTLTRNSSYLENLATICCF